VREANDTRPGDAEITEVVADTDRFSSQLGDIGGPRTGKEALAARARLAGESEEFRALMARLDPDWRLIPLLTRADPPLHRRHRR
jgi:hypothetical protein